MAIQSINPKNKQLIKEFSEYTDQQVDDLIDKSHSAFKSWRETSFADKSKLMHKAAEVLRENKEKYAKIITDEVGKTLIAASAEVEKCASVCDYYADNAEEFLTPENVKTDASDSHIRYDPIGVVLAVMPWNFPFWQVFRFAAPALMAGNGGVLKHASNVQMSAFAIEEVFAEAGFPKALFANLCIGSKKVERVIRNPKIVAATLTGSEKAGESVAAIAGSEIKKTVMELGGSDAFIVLADADIDLAVSSAVTARMQYNCGQSCIAAKRFIVDSKVINEFETKLTAATEKLTIGDPYDEKTDVGPMTNQQMVDDISSQVDKSVEMGAKILLGGKITDESGCYYPPTIITNTKPEMPVCNQETFGPVFAIIEANDTNHAIEIANSSIYGLGSSLFTSDIATAKSEIAATIESGAVFINGPMKSDPKLPFGGIKKSGYGRELSSFGIKEFVNVKTVWIK